MSSNIAGFIVFGFLMVIAAYYLSLSKFSQIQTQGGNVAVWLYLAIKLASLLVLVVFVSKYLKK